jgi:DNA-directed RNA polymerase specialized sigma24 family protein
MDGPSSTPVTMMPLEQANLASDPTPVDVLALDEALQRPTKIDPRKARAIELKFFGGLEMTEIATVLKVSVKAVERDIRLGAAWLRSALSTPAQS